MGGGGKRPAGVLRTGHASAAAWGTGGPPTGLGGMAAVSSPTVAGSWLAAARGIPTAQIAVEDPKVAPKGAVAKGSAGATAQAQCPTRCWRSGCSDVSRDGPQDFSEEGDGPGDMAGSFKRLLAALGRGRFLLSGGGRTVPLKGGQLTSLPSWS